MYFCHYDRFVIWCGWLFGTDEFFEEKRGIPGGLALACLQDDKFEKMKIHFLYEKGYDPVAMDLVKTRLQQVCDKPGGIQIVANEIDFSEKTPGVLMT